MLQNSNPEVPTINLVVEGEGEYPQVDLNTYSLDFGGVPVGTCKTLSYVVFPSGGIGSQLTNICPDPSSDMQISLVGPNGPFSSACQSVFFSRVGGKRSAQVWVRYCPSNTNDLSAVIRHTSSEPSAPSIELTLTGKGVRPEIEILNPTVNFGTINLGSTAASVVRVRYRNVTPTGNITLSTSIVSHPFSLEGAVGGNFSATFVTTASVTGATFSVRVLFTPTVAGLVRTTFAAVLVAPNGTTTDTFTFLGRANGASITANANQTLNFNGAFLLTPNTRQFPLRYDNITTNTITISPTDHPAFLLMHPATGMFSTTAEITLTVGGNPTTPVSSTATLFARFLPVRGGVTTATLNILSAPMGGSTSTSETLRLLGNGLAPFLSATTATNQGTLRFNAVPFGAVRYYQYTLSYRNITSGTIEVNVPAGSSFDVAQSSSGSWTSAGQTLALTNIPATSATASVNFWVRYTANNATLTRSTIAHVSLGGDSRTNNSDDLLCIGSSILPSISITPGTLNFTTIGITKSSVSTYQIDYQNITTQTIRVQPQGGFGFSTTATGPFTTTGTLEIRTPAADGTLQMWALFTASTTAQISITIPHTAPDALGQTAARDDLRCSGRGKPFLAIYERGDWGCVGIQPLQSYTFNVKQPLRAGDVRSEGKIIRIEHAGISQPITIKAPEGYVISVAGDQTFGHPNDGSPLGNFYAQQNFTFRYFNCDLGSEQAITKKQGYVAFFTDYAATSSNATISSDKAKYESIFYEDGSFVSKNSFEIWVNSIAPVSCGKTVTLTVASGTASTTLTVTTICQNDTSPAVCISDGKRLIPNDRYLQHTFPSSILPIPSVFPASLNGAFAQWYICNPVNPKSTIKVAEAWKIFDFQGSTTSMHSVTEELVWDKHPDFIDNNGNSKVEYAYENKLYNKFEDLPVIPIQVNACA